MFAISWLFVAIVCIVFGGLDAKNIFDHKKTATAQGSVVKVHTEFPASQNTAAACSFSYSFTVSSVTYRGDSGSTASSSYCDLSSNSAVTIHYNPADPSDNGLSNTGGVAGVAFVIIGVACGAIGIFILRKARNKMDDRATSAQIALIENGLQDLGEYWQPRPMTRAEAEQVIDDINSRLVAQNKQPLR